MPPLMIICGANGSGKSTLLWALKQRQGLAFDERGGEVLYQGPHRAIRRQTVRRGWLGGAAAPWYESLAADQFSAPEGLQVPYPSRSPDNIDESGSAIKHALGRLENRRQTYLTKLVDATGKSENTTLDAADLPHVFAPLADIVNRLLPHLTFEGIDFQQEDNIRVAFKREMGGELTELDLDDLSSGEKAVILMFLPLVESEIRDNLERLQTVGQETGDAAGPVDVPDRLYLLDEPELHLHPDLQRRMLAYMRERSAGGENQFVIVTHSPTILDEAADEELYVLGPPNGESNQLQPAASPSERLEALRELTGESYFISTGRNIVCLEGQAGSVKGKLSDRSLIELLTKRSGRYTFVPMGGKSQVMSAVARLQESLPVEQYGVSVIGLVDSDQSTGLAAGVIAWPFCEIENILINPGLISQALDTLGEASRTSEEVQEILNAAGEALRDDEVRLRVGSELGTVHTRLAGTTVEDVAANVEAGIAELRALLDSHKVAQVVEEEQASVADQLQNGTFVRKFRGKKLLRETFRRLELTNVGYDRFCYAVALAASKDEETQRTMTEVFDQLDDESNSQTATLLAGSGEGETSN